MHEGAPQDNDSVANIERTFNLRAGEELAAQMKDWSKFGRERMREMMLEQLKTTSPEIAGAALRAMKAEIKDAYKNRVGKAGSVEDTLMNANLDTVDWLEEQLKNPDRLAA